MLTEGKGNQEPCPALLHLTVLRHIDIVSIKCSLPTGFTGFALINTNPQPGHLLKRAKHKSFTMPFNLLYDHIVLLKHDNLEKT